MIPDAAVEAASSSTYEKFEHEMGEKFGLMIQSRTVLHEFKLPTLCSAKVGPIPKLDGKTCLCEREDGHPMPHECACGSWFEGCGSK